MRDNALLLFPVNLKTIKIRYIMKKLFTLALTVIAFAGFVHAQTPGSPGNTVTTTATDDPDAPEFKWAEETHDFGTIPQSIPVDHKFEFTNTGKKPLIISNVQKTCGCTVTDWTKEPIAPGAKGFVMAQFNAAKEGPFTKAITVQSNAKTPNVKLYFKGTVQKSETTGGAPEQNTIFNQN
jgi:hypothetical protein